MILFDTKEFNGYTVNVYYDECPESPREWSNLGTIYNKTSHFRADGEDLDQFILPTTGKLDTRTLDRGYIWLPVWAFEHSGVYLRAAANNPFTAIYGGWDTGLFGIVAVSRETVRREYGCKHITPEIKKKVLGALKAEIEEYSNYLNGEVYGYVLTDSDGEEIDSCWGYYGSDLEENGLLDAARGMIPAELLDVA